jgi:hypothetical protein
MRIGSGPRGVDSALPNNSVEVAMKTSQALSSLLMIPLILSIGPAHSQSMELDCPKTGTVLKFSTGQSLKATGREGAFCKFENDKGVALEAYALMYLFNEARRKDPVFNKVINPIAVEKLWPLSVGKTHAGRATPTSYTFDLIDTVTGIEKLETPMGSHEVFVVENKENGVYHSFSAYEKWWISPQVRDPLKYEFRNSLGRSVSYTVTEVIAP